MIYDAPVQLCDLDFQERGLVWARVNPEGRIETLATATAAQNQAVVEYLAVATPCQHRAVSEPQLAASDEWASINAQLAAIPAGAEYDAIRDRLTARLSAARDKVNGLGGLA
jgi:hypothetical protein